jgi:chromosome segregation ATPase
MNIFKDILAKLDVLHARADATDKAEITGLKATITGELTQAQADLATAKQTISTLETQKAQLSETATSITTQLDSALTALKLNAREGASGSEKIALLQNAMTEALAKFNVPVAAIPTAAPASAAAKTESKNFTERCRAANAAKA